MQDAQKEQFFNALFRFRKIHSAFLPECAFQMGELSVMWRVKGCCCDPNHPPSVSEICDTLHVSKPAVSQILNTLEKKGYIIRQIDPIDRRKISVAATPHGILILEECVQQYDHALQELTRRYGEKELCALVEQMSRLSDIYDQLRTERADTK